VLNRPAPTLLQPGPMRHSRAVVPLVAALSILSACKSGTGACDPADPSCSGDVPTVSIADVSVDEGTGGSVDAVFEVTLSAASTSTVTVNYATADGTASAPDDFEAVSGTLAIAPGSTSGSVTVPVLSDIVGEAGTETFTVVLTMPTHATIADGTATGTITDDDDCTPLAALTPGQTVAGDLTDTDCTWTTATDYYDMYLVSVSEDATIAVDLTSNAKEIDPYLALFSLDGTTDVQDDDGGYDLNAREALAVSAGTYVAFAATSSATGETGSYELSVTEVPSGVTYYGSTGGTASTLHTIDPVSGEATLVGAVQFDSVGALAFHPTTDVLYGEGARVADGVRVLISIDRTTGAGAEIGATGANAAADLAFRADGTLFLYTTKHDVYTVNTSSGVATLLGPSGVTQNGGNGIAFSAAAVLYHSDRDESHSLDTTTGSATHVADMDFPLPCQTTVAHLNGGRFSGVDRPNDFGEFYGIVKCDTRSADPSTFLGQVDFTTGYVILIGQGGDGMDGFAILD
jgi:hypothetical protein